MASNKYGDFTCDRDISGTCHQPIFLPVTVPTYHPEIEHGKTRMTCLQQHERLEMGEGQVVFTVVSQNINGLLWFPLLP